MDENLIRCRINDHIKPAARRGAKIFTIEDRKEALVAELLLFNDRRGTVSPHTEVVNSKPNR